MSIYDQVQEAFKELQDEIGDLEKVAGHELVQLNNSLRATTQAIRAARRGEEFEEDPIEAGAGAIESSLHPQTAATEVTPETKEEIAARADREPDPTVRKNIRDSAAEQAESQRSTTKGTSKSRAKK